MHQLQPLDFVECIDDTPVHRQSRAMPELGRTYTVASVRKVGDGFSIRLIELVPECFRGGTCNCGECGWDSSRFRRAIRPPEDKLAVSRTLLMQPAVLEDCPST